MALSKHTWEFDTVSFMADIRAACGKDASLRDIEAVSGVSASTLSRTDKGEIPGMDVLLTICGILKLDPRKYFYQMEWTGKRIDND